MFTETNGIVIRSVNYKDANKMLTILTGDMGKISASAPRARVKLSRISAGTQLFCYARFTLFENRGRYRVDASEVIEPFFKISENIEALSLSSYFAELCAILGEEDKPGPDILRLMLNSLYMLSQEDANFDLIKAVFELRLMHCSGFSPQISACARCGREIGDGILSVSAGELYCKACAATTPVHIPVTKSVLLAIRYVLTSDAKRIFLFSLSEQARAQFCRVCQAYLLAQVGHSLRTLNYYNSLKGINY